MFRRGLLVVVLILVTYVLNAFLFPFPTRNVPEGFVGSYGFTYSFEQGNWYGYDARSEYVKLLDSAKFDWVRLPFFWDLMTQLRQDSVGQADWEFNQNFDDLKFGIEEAEKRNVKAVIVLGAKTPYYPEYHIPQKFAAKVKFGDTISAVHPIAGDILSVDKKVVNELASYKNIGWWQVENEPFLANVNNWKIDLSMLAAEVKLVRSLDPNKRPVILSSHGPLAVDARWKSFFEILKPGDVFGANAFFEIQGTNLFAVDLFGHPIKVAWPKFLTWPVQSWYGLSPDYSYISKYARTRGVDLWVLEMQADPYIRVLEDAKKQDFYFRSRDISTARDFLAGQRVQSIGLWGANFWLFRQSIGDDNWIKAVEQVVGR